MLAGPKYASRGFLLVHWPGTPAPVPEGLGVIPGQGTRSHKPQLTVCTPQLRAGAAREKIYFKKYSGNDKSIIW